VWKGNLLGEKQIRTPKSLNVVHIAVIYGVKWRTCYERNTKEWIANYKYKRWICQFIIMEEKWYICAIQIRPDSGACCAQWYEVWSVNMFQIETREVILCDGMKSSEQLDIGLSKCVIYIRFSSYSLFVGWHHVLKQKLGIF